MQVFCAPAALAHGGTRIHRALPRTRAHIPSLAHFRPTFAMPVCFSLHLTPFLPRLSPSFLFWGGGGLSLSCAQRDKFREALSAYLNCLDAFTAARKWEKSEQVMRFLLLLLLWRTLAWLLIALLLCVSPSAASSKRLCECA
jgi:hypothetical protein